MRYALHFAAKKFPVAEANLLEHGFPRGATPSQLGGCGTIGSRVSLFGVGLSTFQFRLGRMNAVVAEPGTLARGGFFLGLSTQVRACCQCRSAVAGVRQSSSAGDARPQFSPISCPAASAHRIGALIAAALVGPMSGIYATQAMESRHGAIDAPPGSAAETVVDRLAAQAMLSFRERHGLIADSDFAYAFSSWEEAAQNSGHAVADAWAEVSQDLEMMPSWVWWIRPWPPVKPSEPVCPHLCVSATSSASRWRSGPVAAARETCRHCREQRLLSCVSSSWTLGPGSPITFRASAGRSGSLSLRVLAAKKVAAASCHSGRSSVGALGALVTWTPSICSPFCVMARRRRLGHCLGFDGS